MAQAVNYTETTFNRALPYGIATLAAGTVGAVIACSATSTVAIVAGIALAIIGAYAFLGVVTCGVLHSGDPQAFEENVYSHILTGAGGAIAEILTTVAKEVLIGLIRR